MVCDSITVNEGAKIPSSSVSEASDRRGYSARTSCFRLNRHAYSSYNSTEIVSDCDRVRSTITMDDRWNDFEDALESGESDRVNEVVDEIKEMDLDERIQLFEVCFDDLTGLYAESGDGYIRQSTVRVAERLVPGIALVFAVTDDDRSLTLDVEGVRQQTDDATGFFLEAMTDEDGRVRNSAKRGLKDVFRTYDSLEDEETIEALAVELEEMATDYADKRQEHLLDAKADAEFFLQSGFGRLLEGFQKEFGDSINR